MEQDQRIQAGVDNAARCSSRSHQCMRIVLGSTLLLGGLAAWIASDVVYQALHRVLLSLSVSSLIVRTGGFLLLGVCAIAMISISEWMAIGALMRRVGMPLIWTIHSLPELRHLARDERVRAFNACSFNIFREWQTWAALAAITSATAVGCYFTYTWDAEPHAFILTGLLGGSAGGVIGNVLTYRTRRHLRENLERSQSCLCEKGVCEKGVRKRCQEPLLR